MKKSKKVKNKYIIVFSCVHKDRLFFKRDIGNCDMTTNDKAPFTAKAIRKIEKGISEKYNVKNVVILNIMELKNK